MRYLFLFILLSASAMGEGLPFPSSDSVAVRKTEGMVWNKWETENFVVLSIDFAFGKALKSSVESDRRSVCESWGVSVATMPVKCKLVCVPDAKILSELFSIDSPRCEIRRDGSSAPKEIAIWMDQPRSRALRGLILSVSLHDAPPYIQRGTCALASAEFSVSIPSLSDPSFGVFSLPKGGLSGLDRAARATFDGESAVLCLLARREFGKLVFSELSRGVAPSVATGFRDEKSFLDTAKRYFSNLKDDVQSGRTPASYLEP